MCGVDAGGGLDWARAHGQEGADRGYQGLLAMNATVQVDNGDGSWRRGFWSLIGVQFQGAFSDNLLKWLVTFLVLGMSISAAERDRLVVLVIPLLFAIPFLLFSMAGGYLADRYSKRQVTIVTKWMEICVACVALAGLALGNLNIAFTAVFLLSVQAALFGPSKYGLLPELLPEKKLSWGNGILELGTFIAIITGTMAAGVLADRFRGQEYWPGMLLVSLGIIGLAMSAGITHVPAADPSRRFVRNPVADLGGQIGRMRRDRLLWLAVAGNVFFWFLAALVLISPALPAPLRRPARPDELREVPDTFRRGHLGWPSLPEQPRDEESFLDATASRDTGGAALPERCEMR